MRSITWPTLAGTVRWVSNDTTIITPNASGTVGHESDGHTADFVAECRNLRVGTPGTWPKIWSGRVGARLTLAQRNTLGMQSVRGKQSALKSASGGRRRSPCCGRFDIVGVSKVGSASHLCCSCLQRRPYTEPGDFKRRKLRSQIRSLFRESDKPFAGCPQNSSLSPTNRRTRRGAKSQESIFPQPARHSTEAYVNNSVASVAGRFDPDLRVWGEVVDEMLTRL